MRALRTCDFKKLHFVLPVKEQLTTIESFAVYFIIITYNSLYVKGKIYPIYCAFGIFCRIKGLGKKDFLLTALFMI
jgi:hypothetical protein